VVTETEYGERFRLLRQIGEGGMGAVFEAMDLRTGERIALKTMRHPDGDAVRRLKREFRSLQDLHHPNLVRLGELIEDRGVWFFTMELVKGSPLLEWVRPGGAVDEPRLRDAIGQLASALTYLHQAGKVHRDVKPSNILVTRQGRLVLLDFGLVSEAQETEAKQDSVVGTVAYMAPEQAAGFRVGPEADWYSVGCILYEALTDRLPFDGSPIEIMMEKQRRQPTAPSALAPDAPRDLCDLCMDLLRTDLDRRLAGAAVMAQLSGAPVTLARGTTSSKGRPVFVGRESELAALHYAFQRSRAGAPIAVYVSGESGVGKSALLRRFTSTVTDEDPDVVVLAGRCYERESVPFKAIDGIIDALATFMSELPRPRAATLVPPRAWLLLQAFPVLRTVDVVADSPPVDVPDPQEARTRMFSALRNLFHLLAERHPVVVVIDDLQWADADSIALLHEIVRPPDAPPLLLLCTWRCAPDEEAATRARLFTLGIELEELSLGRLSSDEARALARDLLHRIGGDKRGDGAAAAIAREAEGHPLFIDELVRHAVVHGGEAPASVEDSLWHRIATLEDPARRLLCLAAATGAALHRDVAARATGLRPRELARWIAFLRVANLVRTRLGGASDAIEPYHDRVRAAVMSRLPAGELRGLHRDIARAMEASGQLDAEALAVHLHAAGDDAAAAVWAEKAAHQAEHALAFDRAAELYRLTLRLLGTGHREHHRLTIQLADALANAGRGGEAAQVYLDAADEAPTGEARDLQRRAAQQFIVTGHLDRGLATLAVVLGAEGLRFPASPRQALATILRQRLRLRLRGLSFKRRDVADLSERELARIDMCWHVSMGLGAVDSLRSNVFHLEGLTLALEAGEPYRLARALAIEASFLGSDGSRRARRRYQEVMSRAEQLAHEVDEPHALALTLGIKGQTAFFDGHFASALEELRAAEQLFRERCAGATRETAVMRVWSLRCLYYLGRIRELAQQIPASLQEYKDRGDLYGSTSVRGSVAVLVHLAGDQPEVAARELDATARGWSTVGFHVQHYYVLLSRVAVALYQDDVDRAHGLMEETWKPLERSMLLRRVQFVRIAASDARGRAAVAAAAADAEARPRLLKQVESLARALRAEDRVWGHPLALLLRAAAASQRGDGATTRRLLEEAIDRFDAQEMALHAAAARWRLGELLGDDEGAALRTQAEVWMQAEGVAVPARMVAVLAPGFTSI